MKFQPIWENDEMMGFRIKPENGKEMQITQNLPQAVALGIVDVNIENSYLKICNVACLLAGPFKLGNKVAVSLNDLLNNRALRRCVGIPRSSIFEMRFEGYVSF